MSFALFRHEAVFDPYLKPYRIRADRIMLGLNLFLTVICLALAPLNGRYLSAFLISLSILLIGIFLTQRYPGRLITRLFIACGFMAYTGLIIHEAQGDIEAHFSGFGLIGALLYYRDWRTIIAASVFIYLHHLLLGYAQTLGFPVYVFDSGHYVNTLLIHIAYFVPFVALMIYLSIWLRRDGYQDQQTIALAQHIANGNLLADEAIDVDMAKMPLISAVTSMKNRLLDLLRIMPVAAAVIRVDSEKIVSVNDSWQRTLGDFNFNDQRISELPLWSEPDTWNNLLLKLRSSPDHYLDKIEVLLKKSNGSAFLAELSLIEHQDMAPVMAILTLEDISRKRQSELTMQRLAYHDMLTDLPNRTSLYAELEKALKAWQSNATPFAVILLDLDGFKPVNDGYGHDAGDEVLKIIAARIQQINRKSDLATRLGGDEFVIVVNAVASAQQAIQVAQRFIDALSQPISLTVNNGIVQISASAGISMVSEAHSTIEMLLKQADTALYAAKASGKAQVSLFQRQSQRASTAPTVRIIMH